MKIYISSSGRIFDYEKLKLSELERVNLPAATVG